jgi:(1->4)-alpha-D-glucan 1-alpha-D-glucosylmutase
MTTSSMQPAQASAAPELRATYRLQLTPQFGFDAARELIPYLRDLGISHLYLSPSLQARTGSTHGYDVVDPTNISADLGGERAFRELCAAAHGSGLGIVLDTVPNHMAVDPANRFWRDPELRQKFFDVDPVSGRHRRFFDVDDLAGVRIEDDEVFSVTHGLVLRLLREHVVDGLRIDHPDGLADPAGYLQRLHDGGAQRIWVEKILGTSERLPEEWPASGTVGYEFLNDVCGLFIDPAGEAALTRIWHQVSGDPRPFGAYALDAKLEQARTTFTPELERLARVAASQSSSDQDRHSVEALALALSTMPVYRTYDPLSAGEFITRFQQTSPAVMAKGVEDTAFYRYGRLLALNDVGGEPSRFGICVEDFHARNAERAVRHPEAMLTTMTHDTKRSTDVRAHIAALSQMPEQWEAVANQWLAFSERHCTTLAGGLAPDAQERYFILQTLVGAWPIETERLDGYLEKALREAKRSTSWVEPNAEYEQAVKEFIRSLTSDLDFLSEFEPFLRSLAGPGRRSVLGQLALKLTSPGVPDTYQGDELELRALVDPDNRRPVDWALRRERLSHLMGGGAPGRDLGDLKLWVTSRLLGLRARRRDAFGAATAYGSYEPIDAGSSVCAYLRGGDVLTVVSLSRAGADPDATLVGAPTGTWRDVLSGRESTFTARTPVRGLVDEDLGLAVFERL